jgi:hypothetical protein
MSLVNFQVETACFDPKQLLLALSQVIPAETISNAIETTCSWERRQRRLPTYVIVTLVIAMSFWSSDSIVDVFKNLIHGLSSLQIPLGIRWQVPSSSSITEAHEKGVGDRVWGVGNPILKSRGFKMDAVFLAHTCLAIHLFLFSIFKNRGLYPLGVGERSLPTPHTPHPSWSKNRGCGNDSII